MNSLKTSGLHISISDDDGHKFTMRSTIKYKPVFLEDDVITVLEEVVRMLKAPTVEDTEIF